MKIQELPNTIEAGADSSPRYDWNNLTLISAQEDEGFHKLLRDPRDHADFVFEGIAHLEDDLDNVELARILGILNEINVIDPMRIGITHNELEADRFGKILKNYPHYKQNSDQVYEAVIANLRNGKIGDLQRMLGMQRKKLGIATPFPTEMLLTYLASKNDIHKPFSELFIDDLNQIFLSQHTDNDIVNGIDLGFVFTSTGTGRNTSIRSKFNDKWNGGTYVEVGGSIGINPMELKKEMGFSTAVSLDKMTEHSANEITEISDYKNGKLIPLTKELRSEIAREVKRHFSVDARNDFSQLVDISKETPLVVGIHNLLVHVTEKDKIIQNALKLAMDRKQSYLWTSGGYNGNESVLYNFVLKLEEGRVKSTFVDRFNEQRTGGTAVNISSLSDMQRIFIDARNPQKN